jgi:N-acyl-phosphatidylethanolamine-hydrolysing phospholipase D
MQAAVDLGAKNVVAMHYGTFDLTDEPLDEPPRWFRAEADKRRLDPARVWTLNVGETRRF